MSVVLYNPQISLQWTHPFIGTAVAHVLVAFLLNNVQGSSRRASSAGNSNPNAAATTTTTITTIVQTADGGRAGDVAAAAARGVALTLCAARPAAA